MDGAIRVESVEGEGARSSANVGTRTEAVPRRGKMSKPYGVAASLPLRVCELRTTALPQESSALPTPIFAVPVLMCTCLVLWLVCRRTVPLGSALVVSRSNGASQVVFGGSVLVFPGSAAVETMKLMVHPIRVRLEGATGLSCRDHIRADIEAIFYVRVNACEEDVLKVARILGCEGASDLATLEQRFSVRFIEALRLVGKRVEFNDILRGRDDFRDQVAAVCSVGHPDGFLLEEVSIHHLEQTPISKLDPTNLHDAQGIRKITEQTSAELVAKKQAELQRDQALLKLQQAHAGVQRRLH